jgi:O-antigen/teichoic acid export membrane protein
VNGAQNGVLSGFEAFKRIARINLISGLLNFPAVIGGAFFFGLSGMIWGMILAQAAGCLLNYYALRRVAAQNGVAISYASVGTEASVIWNFSIPAVLGSLLIAPVTWACASMLVRKNDGLNQMGAYNAANQWFNALMWLPYMLGGVTLPMLAERFGAGDGVRSAKLLMASIKINAAITFPLVLVGCLLSPLIMAAYGKDFRSEWPTLVATLLTATLLALQIPVGYALAASGRMWVGFFMNVGWSMVFLVSTHLLLVWGSLGLASARLLAYLFQAVCAFVFAWVAIRGMGIANNCSETVAADSLAPAQTEIENLAARSIRQNV